MGIFIEVDYTEPDIEYTLVGTAGGNDPDTGDIYRGFDRFGRVKDSYWYDYGSSTDVDRIKYGYDRNGSRLYRENTVATANNAYFDEKYLYDLIDRLKHMDRGRLTAQKDGVTDKTFAQCWTLDATGNWRKFLEDSDGDGSCSLDQTRTANKVNEITDLTESIGPSWVTPIYSRAGNMTTIPKPADPTASFTGTYDAWNRLVRIEEGSDKVAEYEYDGAKRRTVKKTYVSGVLDETRHFYYTEPSKWQVVEERIESSSDADRQFVWGLRYVDDLVLRDRDTNGDTTLDERLYGMQDANWNLTALADAVGSVQERYSYDAYGTSIALTPSFAYRVASSFAWEVRYACYRFDSESELYYVRNRIYHPVLSWLQRDPRPLTSLHNLLDYVFNSPINRVDSRGDVGPLIIVIVIIGGIVIVTIKGDRYEPPPPPQFPYWTPGYGHYCGPRCGEPKTPHDCVDTACRQHDHCLGTFGDWIDWSKKKKCEEELCKSVYACDCSMSPTPADCRSAKLLILAYSCSSWLVQEGLELPGEHDLMPIDI